MTLMEFCEPTERLQQRNYSHAPATSSEFILIINKHHNNPVLITSPPLHPHCVISNRTSLAGLLVHRVLQNFTLKSSVANFNYFLPAAT